MVTTHNLGLPRIGAKCELKFALEAYWKGQSTLDALKQVGQDFRQANWALQSPLDWAPVVDFACYDRVLYMRFTLGNLPVRVQGFHGDVLDNTFRVACGWQFFWFFKRRFWLAWVRHALANFPGSCPAFFLRKFCVF